MIEWIKKHILFVVTITLFFILGIPLFIHILFKIRLGIPFLEAEWSAGDALGYYGAVLSFLGTIVLGALALYQNHIIKVEADRRTTLLEQREHDANMPKFAAFSRGSSGNCSHLRFEIRNISENFSTNVEVSNIHILTPNNEEFWETSISHSKISFPPGESLEIELNNPSLTSDGYIFEMRMRCKDKYDSEHKYIIKGIYTIKEKFPQFSIAELVENKKKN